MKIFLWTASITISTILLLIAIMNLDAASNLVLINQNYFGEISFFPSSININTGLLLIIFLVGGEFIMLCTLYPLIMKKNEKESAYERRLEKTSVSNDESSAKVKVLEAKIEVLEKALKDALNQN